MAQLQTKPLILNSKCILPMIVLYITATLAADVVAYKFVSIGVLVESGATIIFPLTYLLGDMITEVYGYKIARKIVWLNLGSEFVFALLVMGVLHMKGASFWHEQKAFNTVLGQMFRFVVSGIMANAASDFLNIYLISKWKIFMRGKHFWLRSVASTAISEFVLVAITVFLAFTGTVSTHDTFKIFFSAYALEIFYACIFVWPGWIIILILKRIDRQDAFDHGIDYNMFKF